MSARTAETVSQLVSVLTLSARIAESGSITHLPETVRPVGWAAHYAGAEQPWERVAEARVNQEVVPLLAEIARAEPPADVAHLYVSVESWRRAAVAETRRTASEEAYERVVGEMRREALAAIDAEGAAFQPVGWEESTRIFRVQGEWTVTVSVSGTDHSAVRETFTAGLPVGGMRSWQTRRTASRASPAPSAPPPTPRSGCARRGSETAARAPHRSPPPATTRPAVG
ncbi:hypothetical protein QFZ82_007687 [Streptomyces sp. V4I23]|uniref:hypothetical protein n=1 Tax=Streptomyces sp. V4I23 TaxID=3042282 RepID=UPI002786546D|nr:hypothetical protein [Streptomyces sp. V4I23]MDQ1013202.1 hypothetical protein [Streptomyces sp. V4I23]